MKLPILVVAIACLIAIANPVSAQFGAGPNRPAGGRGGIVLGGVPYAHGPGARNNARGVVLRPTFVVPLGIPIFPFSSLGWLGVWAPPVGVAPRTVVVISPLVFNGGTMGNPGFNPFAMPLQLAPEDELPPGAKPDDLVVIRPKKALPLLPPPDAAPPKVARVIPPAPRPLADADPFAPRRIVNLDKPDPDPVKEVARLIKLGKEAFASGEFGAASEQFDRAIAVAPKDPLPHFLKAQAAFAAGQYDDAVSGIRAGLEFDRNWPSSPFDPKELNGANPGLFNDHLAALRGVVAANPREPALEFLLGYELWFIGEKVEAKKWFDLAEKRLPAPGPIALFK
ncbi:MAG TPA: tetratricopeptide repeat protein [Gemmata sp.]|nr:tetratricopeptide repeat protein [Gemmata sp.]